MNVVKADVEQRARFARNKVDGLVADIERNEFKMRWLEVIVAVIERLRLQRRDQLHQPADRLVGALGIGDVALLASDDQMAVERTAPPDLDGVAERLDIARFAQHAMRKLLTLVGAPLQQLGRA